MGKVLKQTMFKTSWYICVVCLDCNYLRWIINIFFKGGRSPCTPLFYPKEFYNQCTGPARVCGRIGGGHSVCHLPSFNSLWLPSSHSVCFLRCLCGTRRAATWMTRLELCAALDAVRSAATIIEQLQRKPAVAHYYSDSKVVLSYLFNETRAFCKYVKGASMSSGVFHLHRCGSLSTRSTTPLILLPGRWARKPCSSNIG